MPSQISGGMARRVALARAIALDTDVVLYDNLVSPPILALTRRDAERFADVRKRTNFLPLGAAALAGNAREQALLKEVQRADLTAGPARTDRTRTLGGRRAISARVGWLRCACSARSGGRR